MSKLQDLVLRYYVLSTRRGQLWPGRKRLLHLRFNYALANTRKPE